MPDEKITLQGVWKDYTDGVGFKNQIGLYEAVRNNENFYNDRQWEGVQANGQPTPVTNFIARIVQFRIASIVSDNVKMQTSPLSSTSPYPTKTIEEVGNVVNRQFESLFERNKMGNLLREYVRNAAVDGDGCLYTYFDENIDTGQLAKGDIQTEIVENTRVIFGNPNDRRVEKQPWIIISRREMVDEVRRRVKKAGGNPDQVKADTDDAGSKHDNIAGDKCTVVLRFWREYYNEGDIERSRIMACECTNSVMIRKPWDTGLTLYPITWFSMKFLHDCYHGQADVTGLIPNQVYVNQMMALAQISTKTTAFPKVVYDQTRLAGKWDNRVGAAIPINGGNVGDIAKIIEPAQMSPQISEFINKTIDLTKDVMGATDAALGNASAYNTSALISQQRATMVPLEMAKQDLYQSVEDLGRIYIDFMSGFYGARSVDFADPQSGDVRPVEFDFSTLRNIPLSLKLDVGASAYWSEIASVQTLENLHMQGKISSVQFLERLPSGHIPKQQELIAELKQLDQLKAQLAQMGPPTEGEAPPGDMPPDAPVMDMNQPIEMPTGKGYSQLQRAVNETGVTK